MTYEGFLAEFDPVRGCPAHSFPLVGSRVLNWCAQDLGRSKLAHFLATQDGKAQAEAQQELPSEESAIQLSVSHALCPCKVPPTICLRDVK